MTIPLLIVGSYRDDALTSRYPLAQQLPHLVRDTHAERLTLQPIDRSGLADLVKARYCLADPDVEKLADMLVDLTQGNALFANELLRSFEESGTLTRNMERWVLTDVAHLRIPNRLREVIDVRLQRLTPEARSALQVAAMLGENVSLDLWAAICGFDDATLLDICDEALEARILDEGETTDQLRFHHALIRDALVESLHGPRRRLWHQKIAEAYASSRPALPDLVAQHYQEANDPRAVEWLIEAGRRAHWSHAWVEAADHFDAAANWLRHEVDRTREYSWLQFWSGIMRRFDDPQRGLAAIQDVLPAAMRLDDPLLRALASFYSGYLQFLLGDMRRGIREAEAACRETDAALRAGAFDACGVPPLGIAEAQESVALHCRAARLLSDQPDHPICLTWGTVVTNLAWLGYIEEALTIGEALATIWPPDPERARLTPDLGGNTGSGWADLYNGLGIAYALVGRPDDADRAFASARAMYQAIDHRMLIGDVYSQELELVLLPYRTEQVRERGFLAQHIAAMYQQVVGTFSTEVNLPLVASISYLALLECRWSDIQAAEEAYGSEETNVSWWHIKLGTVLAQLKRDQGKVAEAWEFIHELLPTGAATEPGNQGFIDVLMIQELAAGLAMDAGDLPTAHEWIVAHGRWVEWSGAVIGRAEGHLLWTRFCSLTGDNESAMHHARTALDLASEPRQPLLLSMAHRAVGRLEIITGNAAAAAHHLDQSLSLSTACALPYERAVSMQVYADLYLATGQFELARIALQEVRRICEPIRAETVLARVDAAETQLPLHTDSAPQYGLSPRELDVLRLIAAGRSNKDIAHELSMSVRTVERHSANIYTKIDVSSRAEAIALAHRHNFFNS
ncbi:MAG: LuxR C-terminal-related transcriptional regulator [Thermomicrobiales bacterium]|nr:LuxR C-terminal-related transcriptional regulator [Thermomicrobiales bacterium]